MSGLVPAQPRRLAEGGRIDRTRALSFSFDGRAMQGYAGDTLASALLAGGVDTVARSLKYGRRRGIVGHGPEEPNAIVHLGSGPGSLPNQRATEVELYEGLAARSTRSGPQRLLGAFSGLLPAGFYYKTFMRPRRLWMMWERLLRRAAGFGEAPDGPDPDTYDKLNQHCDVLVVGAGPAGLAAALEAARSGARTLIADEQREFGGSLLGRTPAVDGGSGADWVQDAIAELSSCPNATLLPRATVSGYYDHNFFTILERRTDHLPAVDATGARQRLHRVRARQAVLATGAIERPLVFANNDLPGVMLASSVSTYLHRYAVAPGDKLVLFTTNDNAYRTAIDWRRAGREVVGVVDARQNPSGALVQAAMDAGIDVISGHGVVEALGRSRVRSAVIAPMDAKATR